MRDGIISHAGASIQEGSSFLDKNATKEMLKIHVEAEGGHGGLGWLYSSYDNREYIGLDTGVYNPGVAGLVSFNPNNRIGLVLLSNGDMSENGNAAPMSKMSTITASKALNEIRDYFMDWYEASSSSAPTTELFSRSSQAQRLLATETMLLVEAYDIGMDSVSCTIYFSFGPGGFHDIPSGRGNNIRIRYGKKVVEFFPQKRTGNFTTNLIELRPETTYDAFFDILNHENTMLFSRKVTITTLPPMTDTAPPLSVKLDVFSGAVGKVNYTAYFSSLRIQDNFHLHLNVKKNSNYNPAANSYDRHHHIRFFPAVSTGSVSGQLDLRSGEEYSFRLDAVDSSHGTHVSSRTTTVMILASKERSSPIKRPPRTLGEPFFRVEYPGSLLGGLQGDERGTAFPTNAVPTIYSVSSL